MATLLQPSVCLSLLPGIPHTTLLGQWIASEIALTFHLGSSRLSSEASAIGQIQKQGSYALSSCLTGTTGHPALQRKAVSVP